MPHDLVGGSSHPVVITGIDTSHVKLKGGSSQPVYWTGVTQDVLDQLAILLGVGAALKQTRVVTTYTILTTDNEIFGNTDAGPYTVTLPVGQTILNYRIINSGSSGNDLAIAPNGSEHLLGVNSNWTLFDAETLEISYNPIDGWY